MLRDIEQKTALGRTATVESDAALPRAIEPSNDAELSPRWSDWSGNADSIEWYAADGDESSEPARERSKALLSTRQNSQSSCGLACSDSGRGASADFERRACAAESGRGKSWDLATSHAVAATCIGRILPAIPPIR